MAKNNVADRVTALEAEVAQLRAEIERLNQPKDWRSVVGMFAGDEFMKEVDEAGRRIREQDREPAKRKRPQKRRLARS